PAGETVLPGKPALDGDDFGSEPARRVPLYAPDAGTEAQFRTLSVQWGDRSLYRKGPDPVPWSILGDTAQGLPNQDEGVVEHYEARNEGVEVSWVLSQRPFGPGPLEIDAQLTGLQYVGQTDTGHHFADSQGTPRVQVGNAVAVDARGIRTELPFRA